jgi:hypothetical protein
VLTSGARLRGASAAGRSPAVDWFWVGGLAASHAEESVGHDVRSVDLLRVPGHHQHAAAALSLLQGRQRDQHLRLSMRAPRKGQALAWLGTPMRRVSENRCNFPAGQQLPAASLCCNWALEPAQRCQACAGSVRP